ncbi:MAG TPA: YbjN domain-containing protein [Spirochaetia bacterium]|nr:YbjN domain-containing protein [Spirochaetia bacterium]
MTLHDKVEGYLVKLGLSFHEAAPGTWVVTHSEVGLEALIVQLADSVVVLRAPVMEVPVSGREKLFQELLRLNASDMIHGAYAVDGSSVIIIDTLEAETMDLEELQASIDAIGLALAQHYRSLSAYRTPR